ncbi:MAG: hypothetical protein KDD44_11110 [Bdellovibrionales bacterium]|nr:hypothetical protein [Bdellovibrionales bacterium]
MKLSRREWVEMLVVSLLCSQCLGAPASVGAESIAVQQRYSGQYHSEVGFSLGKERPFPPRVIRSEKEFRLFKEGLPEYAVTKMRPAPKNRDPLRNASPIEFSKSMLLVVFNTHSGAPPEIASVEEREAEIVVRFFRFAPDACAMCADASGTGSYAAVLVPASRARVRFTEVE